MPYLKTRLACFSAASFAVLGVWMPFWPKWLEGRGWAEAEIGLLASAWAIARGVSSPLFAQLVDRGGRRRLWLFWLSLATVLAFVPLPWLTSFPLLLMATMLVGALNAPVIHLGENSVALSAQEHGFSFGSLRLYGSLSFVALSTFCGWFIDNGQSHRVYFLLLFCFALSALAAWMLPAERKSRPAVQARLPLRQILHQRRLCVVLAGSGVLQASHITYYTFSTLHWTEAGLSTALVGRLWAEGVIAEVLMFAFSASLLRKLGSLRLLLCAVCAAVVRWSALGLSTDFVLLSLVQWLHAFTFGAAHLATMNHVAERVPRELSGTAHSLYAAFNIAANVAAVACVTPIFEQARGQAYGPMIVLALFGGLLACWGMK